MRKFGIIIAISILAYSLAVPNTAHSKISTVIPTMKKETYKHPDFDYPQATAQKAEALLAEALKKGNGDEVIRNIVVSSIAKSMISTDNAASILERIDSVAGAEKNAVTRALLYNFEAKMLSQYYRRFYYKIRGRKTTTDSESDIDEWSSARFEARIVMLARKSVEDADALSATPVTSLGDIITTDSHTATFYPTVYDIVGWDAISIIGNLDAGEAADKLTADIKGTLCSLHASDYGPLLMVKTHGKETDELKDIYDEFIGRTDMAYFAIGGAKKLDKKGEYATYCDFLRRYPQSLFADNVKRLKASVETKRITPEYKDRFSSTEPIRISCKVTNSSDFSVYILQLPEYATDLYKYKGKFSALPIRRHTTVHLDDTLPFNDTVEVTLQALPYGRYFVYCDPDTKSGPDIYSKMEKVAKYNFDTFIVSDVMLFSTSVKEDVTRIYAVDANTGAPLRDVKLSIKDCRSLTTDVNGMAEVRPFNLGKNTYSSFNVTAKRGADIYTTGSFSFHSRYGHSDAPHAAIFTDLAVYHPGDTVRFTAICYTNPIDAAASVEAGRKLSVDFLDSNYEPVDSACLTTDEMGRVSGTFVIPHDRMNGTFSINVGLTDRLENTTHIASHSVEVSEYKVPTFYVTADDREIYESGKDAVITGKALTYTGMPVAGARITAELSSREYFWRFFDMDPGDAIGTFDATTGADGSFSITVPAGMLTADEPSAMPRVYCLTIDVTSDAGETQTAEKSFRTGQFCVIHITDSSSDFCFNAESDIKLPIEVKNTDETEKFLCSYTIADRTTGEVVATGSFEPKNPVIPANSSMKSGVFILTVTAAHDARLVHDITIFRPGDKMPPLDSPLWIPACENRVDDNNRITLLLGNSNADSHIYCIAASRSKIIFDGWLRKKPGMHRLTFDIPRDENEFVDLTFITTYKGTTTQRHFRHASKYRPADIKIHTVAFRDNLVPGLPERWTFKLLDSRGELATGAMLCEMYDKALTQIKPNDWNLRIDKGHVDVAWSSIARSGLCSPNFITTVPTYELRDVEISQPELNTYGVSLFYPTHTPRMRMVMSKAGGVMIDDNSAEIMMDAAPSMAVGSMSDMAEESEAELEMGAGTTLDKVRMRTADVKTALWQPELRTDGDGYIYVDFTSPLFNTTWLMQAIAYTADMHTASMVREVVTSKPIMVRATLPRFLRQGDKTQLASTISNATDSTQRCTAVIELFVPDTDEVIASRTFEVELAAKESKAIAIDWSVADAMPGIGYRVKAATSLFGDGEQHSIVILPSVSPIIETKPFFIDASLKDFSLKLPKFPKGSRVTLEYCDNPVWYCVTALPSVKSDDITTSTALAHSLYALTLADGIANSDPEIREAIEFWNANEADSTLISNLEKNSELKIGTLLASPWLREAQRQTLRMRSIADLFDADKNAAETEKIISKLEEMQMPDGGWTWVRYNGCKSSLYSTQCVLQLVGELRHIGLLTGNSRMNAMLRKALAYYDATELDMFNRRTVKNDYGSLSDYVYTRSFFKDYDLLPGMSGIFANALTAMKREWKGLNLVEKAYFALALHRNGETSTAKQIIESLRQFAITKPETGMYWDNLNIGWNCFYGKTTLTARMLAAFAEIEPASADIDMIRKWMLLDKQANDWGNSSMASEAIYGILSSGSKWLGKQAPASIAVAGNKVSTSKADEYIGYFKRSLPVESATEAMMTVSRNGNSPAWGALFCQYSAPMTEVKAVAVDELSIEKDTYVVRGDQLLKSDKMNVGDRVQVRMVIKSSCDLEYVTLHDERASCMEPVDQLSDYRWLDGTGFYMEVKDDCTRLFFNYLPKGTHIITYDVHVTAPGEYFVGIASIQSQYAPQIAAHSAGGSLSIAPDNRD